MLDTAAHSIARLDRLLRTPYFDPRHLRDWADAQIARDPDPPHWLLELSIVRDEDVAHRQLLTAACEQMPYQTWDEYQAFLDDYDLAARVVVFESTSLTWRQLLEEMEHRGEEHLEDHAIGLLDALDKSSWPWVLARMQYRSALRALKSSIRIARSDVGSLGRPPITPS